LTILARNEQRFLLPVLGEERVRRDRLNEPREIPGHACVCASCELAPVSPAAGRVARIAVVQPRVTATATCRIARVAIGNPGRTSVSATTACGVARIAV